MKRFAIDRAGRRLRAWPLALALLSAAAPAIAQTSAAPAADEVPPRAQEEICERVHIDEDPAYGVHAKDVEVCRDKSDVERPLIKGIADWAVLMQIDYKRLPEGTKVSYVYDRPAGNCVRDWRDWKETTTAGEHGPYLMFTAVGGSIWESCGYERSYGSWNITARAPTGATGSVNIRIMTGVPSAGVHFAEVQCHFVKGLECEGGSSFEYARFGKNVKPMLRLGPLATPPPGTPQLICTHGVSVKAGKPINDEFACEIDGSPRPALTIHGLPAGLTLAPGPTADSKRLLLSGQVDRSFHGTVTVAASLPDDWDAVQTFRLDVW